MTRRNDRVVITTDNWDTASPTLKLECLQFREAGREVDTGRLTDKNARDVVPINVEAALFPGGSIEFGPTKGREPFDSSMFSRTAE